MGWRRPAQILRHNARFDLTKLIWLNGEYVRELGDERLYELAAEALTRAGLDLKKYPADYVKAALETCKGKFKLFGELPAYAGFYFKDEIEYDPVAAENVLCTPRRPPAPFPRQNSNPSKRRSPDCARRGAYR